MNPDKPMNTASRCKTSRGLLPEPMHGPGSNLPIPLKAERGFALISTIAMMVLLTLLAVGLMSLSTVSLRSSSSGSAQAEARANARLALELAIGDLQRALGDDRRITADASILKQEGTVNAVGVWDSWSPRMAENPENRAPDYESAKEDNFRRWLVSGDPLTLSERDWAKAASEDDIALFTQEADGFRLGGGLIGLEGKGAPGGLAWAVSQAATRAKINVAGPEAGQRTPNDDLQGQPRPYAAAGGFFTQPDGGWNTRAARVLNFNQARLDDQLWLAEKSIEGGRHFTTVGAGLLTNVVDGGLRTDLSLGFEMSDGDFDAAEWRDEGETFKNPFHLAGESRFEVPDSYGNERPLYRPIDAEGTHEVKHNFFPANVHYHFPVSTTPTFDLLRNYCRIPRHLYRSEGALTVFEREADHIAGAPGQVDKGFYEPAPASFDGRRTQAGIRPVMDRVMFLISGGLADNDELRIILTPIITLWNPYNTALEIEGAVSHVWIDIPYDFTWRVYNSRGRPESSNYMYLSGLMGKQFNAINKHTRSVDPYFFAAITATGSELSSSGRVPPIRFEPGEVRVFAPAETRLQQYNVAGTIRERTIFLKPVDDLSQFTTRGGLSIPTRNDALDQGFRTILEDGQSAELRFGSIKNEDYPFYITLEDATRAKGSNPTREDRGQAIADLLTNNFTRSDSTTSFRSPRVPYSQLKRNPVPVGVLESYHRVARSGSEAQISDLVFTGNPRQPWMNPFLTETNFKTGPQYETRMRAVSSFNGVLQTANAGRSAFYGATQTPSGGRTNLSFFEIPRAPLLSLAALQHGDFSGTPFSPANQVGNSWASAYVVRDRASTGPLKVDHSYLLNEALWDGWFFSGASPTLVHSTANGSPQVWDRTVAQVTRPVEAVLTDFATDPKANPLRNPRMMPIDGITDPENWVARMSGPAGCLQIAGELMVDGAFNVNSTSIEAWAAVLSGLRGSSFAVEGQTSESADSTPFPRFRDPVGTANDKWQGFRQLSDEDIRQLATEIVEEVRERGPFLSMAEFVNRRISNDDLGLKGALQAAIDRTPLNEGVLEEGFSTGNYEADSRSNISPADTAVGIPGYLTQADVLMSIAPVINVRSDTFTIRTYGESRNASGEVTARAWAEAVVQRVPEFVDRSDAAHTPSDQLNETNRRFGRRFQLVSFRFLPEAEVRG